MNHFQEQLDRAFPPESDLPIIRAVREAVFMADALIEGDKLLSSALGRDLRGHIRRAAIHFRIHELTQSGDLPFTSTMTRMPRGGLHWVEIASKSVKAHICRTEGPTLFPIDSPTRQDDRCSNQMDLYSETKTGEDISFRVAWLMFGSGDSGSLNHLCWGMPSAKTDVWLARTNILRRAEASGAAEFVLPDTPTAETKLKFRLHIEQALAESVSLKADKRA